MLDQRTYYGFGGYPIRQRNGSRYAVPILGTLIKTARQDLLQIRVTGTLQAPEVQASAFNIFNTTVDDVKSEK